MAVKITIKNYRCFEDTCPLYFELGEGFISLVGPNNSGKSSLLKLFYEFRPLWQYLSNIRNINHSIDSPFRADFIGISDPTEIFADKNNRSLSIEIEFFQENENDFYFLSEVILTLERKEPLMWKATYSYGPNPKIKIRPNNLRSVSDKGDIIISDPDRNDIKLNKFKELMESLEKSIYIGPFRNAVNEGSGRYYDLNIGTAFIKQWNSWKTGNLKFQNSTIQNITESIRKIFNYGSIEINASEDLKTLQINIDNKPYKLKELGAGLAQFIIVLGNVAIQKPPYILIDEPETNLHPPLQLEFLTSLASYTSKGIIFATHSMGLARAASEKIYSFRKDNKENKTDVKLLEQTPNYIEFMGELNFSSYRELGYDAILLVEGVHDVKAIQQFLRKIGRDHKIVIIPLGGTQFINGKIEMQLNELKRITNNLFCLIDSECKDSTSLPSKQRIEFKELCEKLGIKICMTKKRAIENYFTEKAIKKIFGDNSKALEDYEELPIYWPKQRNWRIASEMNWEEIKDTDIGEFLKLLTKND